MVDLIGLIAIFIVNDKKKSLILCKLINPIPLLMNGILIK